MVGRSHDVHQIFSKRFQWQIAVVNLTIDDPDIELPVGNPFRNPLSVGYRDFGFDQRIAYLKIGNNMRQHIFAERVTGADRQVAAGFIHRIVQQRLHLRVQPNDFIGVMKNDFASLIQLHVFIIAVQ